MMCRCTVAASDVGVREGKSSETRDFFLLSGWTLDLLVLPANDPASVLAPTLLHSTTPLQRCEQSKNRDIIGTSYHSGNKRRSTR